VVTPLKNALFERGVGTPEQSSQYHWYVTSQPPSADKLAARRISRQTLLITLLTLGLAFLVYRRFAGGGDAAVAAALEV
jgi:hypothetical protein